jgi:hypothetical protein
MIKIYWIVIALFPLVCYAKPDSATLEIAEKSHDCLRLNMSLSKEKSISGIVLLREPLGKRWLLQLRAPSDMNPSGRMIISTKEKTISTDEYASILDTLLGYISNHKEVGIDYIQLDLSLVDSLWKDAVNAVMIAAKSRGGIAMPKDKIAVKALESSFQKSDVTAVTCRILAKYSLKCQPGSSGIETIAFQSKYVGKGWKDIYNAPDAGLHEYMCFEIGVEK